MYTEKLASDTVKLSDFVKFLASRLTTISWNHEILDTAVYIGEYIQNVRCTDESLLITW